MKKLNLVIYGPYNAWTFTITDKEYSDFHFRIRAGKWATLQKTNWGGNITEINFNSEMIVAMEVSEA